MKRRILSAGGGICLVAMSLMMAQDCQADQTFNDDVIVIGSLGIGLDAVTDQAFGFDTFRLSENNLRIHFEDTSVGAFPSNDWRIIINDTSPGGANFFAIEDSTAASTPFKITAGAPTSSFHMDSSGKIGLKTATPTLDLHIKTGNTPAHRLEQDNSSGFTPQTWDIAGNEANFFIRDVTAGSRLPFRIFPGAPTNSIAIANNGSVGFGTTSPNTTAGTALVGKFLTLKATGAAAADGVANGVVEGSLGAQNHLVHTNGPVDQKIMRLQCSSGFFGFHVLTDNSAAKAVADVISMKMANGNIGLRVQNPAHPLHLVSGAHCTVGGVWTNASSRDLKEKIRPLTGEQARETVRAMQPVEYNYKNQPGENYVGFIAEDVPELVATNDRKSLAAMDITAVLTKVVQEQDRDLVEQKRINAEQRQRLDDQHKVIEKLSERLESLERLMRQEGAN